MGQGGEHSLSVSEAVDAEMAEGAGMDSTEILDRSIEDAIKTTGQTQAVAAGGTALAQFIKEHHSG